MDFRRSTQTLLLNILNNTVSPVNIFRFLGSRVPPDLAWTSYVKKKAQWRVVHLQQRRKFNLLQELLMTFCTSITVFLIRQQTKEEDRS